MPKGIKREPSVNSGSRVTATPSWRRPPNAQPLSRMVPEATIVRKSKLPPTFKIIKSEPTRAHVLDAVPRQPSEPRVPLVGTSTTIVDSLEHQLEQEEKKEFKPKWIKEEDNLEPDRVDFLTPRTFNLPTTAFPLPSEAHNEQLTAFTRETISTVCGGGPQATINPIGISNPGFLKYGYFSNIAYWMSWNPYAPSRPGEHGIVFLDRDADDGRLPDFPKEMKSPNLPIPAFRGLERNKWQYMGVYKLTPSERATGAEWSRLSVETKKLRYDKRINATSAKRQAERLVWKARIFETLCIPHHGNPNMLPTFEQFDQAMGLQAERLNSFVMECVGYRDDFLHHLQEEGGKKSVKAEVKTEVKPDISGRSRPVSKAESKRSLSSRPEVIGERSSKRKTHLRARAESPDL